MKAYHQGQLDFFCVIYSYINALRLLYGIGLPESRHILSAGLAEISTHKEAWASVLQNQTSYYWLLEYLFGRFSHKGGYALKTGRLPLTPPDSKHDDPAFGMNDEDLCVWLELNIPARLEISSITPADISWKPESFTQRAGEGEQHAPKIRPGETTDAAPPLGSRAPYGWDLELLWPLLQYWLPGKGILGNFGLQARQKRCLLLRFHRYLYLYTEPLISHWTTGCEFHKETLQLYDCTADKDAIHSLNPRGLCLHSCRMSQDALMAIEPESVYFIEKA